jgi:hypothetical protein
LPKVFFSSPKSSSPNLEPINPPIQQLLGSILCGKAFGA